MKLRHRCFPTNIAKYLRTSFFIEYLQWLLVSKQSVVMSPHFFVMDLKVGLFTIQSSWPITLVRKSAPLFFSLLIQVALCRFMFFILKKPQINLLLPDSTTFAAALLSLCKNKVLPLISLGSESKGKYVTSIYLQVELVPFSFSEKFLWTEIFFPLMAKHVTISNC